MKAGHLQNVNVGDFIYEVGSPDSPITVVTEVVPSIQSADVLDDTSGENGLRLGLPGTFRGEAEVIGSIPLPEVAQGLVQSSEVTEILGYDFILEALYKAVPVNAP